MRTINETAVAFDDLEKEIFTDLLDQAGNVFANNCCNDFYIQVTKENELLIHRLIQNFTSDQEYREHLFDQVIVGKDVILQDSMLFYYFKHKISKSK